MEEEGRGGRRGVGGGGSSLVNYFKIEKISFLKNKVCKENIEPRITNLYIYIYILGTCRNILDPYKLLESLFIVRLKPVLESDKTSVPLLIVNA